MLVCKFLNVFGKKIGAIRDRIIVQHAGKRSGFENGGDVGFHLAPVSFVNIRGKNHEGFASDGFRGFGLRDSFGGGERGNRGDYRSAPFQSADAIAQDRDLFIEGERGSFAKRAERDAAGAAIFDQPAAVISHEGVVNFSILIEERGDCGHYSLPLHRQPPCNFSRWNASESPPGPNNARETAAGGRNQSASRK